MWCFNQWSGWFLLRVISVALDDATQASWSQGLSGQRLAANQAWLDSAAGVWQRSWSRSWEAWKQTLLEPMCLICPICLPSPYVKPALTHSLPVTASAWHTAFHCLQPDEVSSGVKISGQDGIRRCARGCKWVYFKDWSDQCESGHAGMTY